MEHAAGLLVLLQQFVNFFIVNSNLPPVNLVGYNRGGTFFIFVKFFFIKFQLSSAVNLPYMKAALLYFRVAVNYFVVFGKGVVLGAYLLIFCALSFYIGLAVVIGRRGSF